MSGFCNGCGCGINTKRATWCKGCHAAAVERLKWKVSQPAGGCDFSESLDAVSLHVGFVFVIETDEMLDNLRNEPVAETKPAKGSKISDPAGRVPHPIDRVAARVTG